MKVFKNHMRRYIKLRSQKRNGLFIFPGALFLQKVEKSFVWAKKYLVEKVLIILQNCSKCFKNKQQKTCFEKFSHFFKNFFGKSFVIQKIALPLHSLSGSNAQAAPNE